MDGLRQIFSAGFLLALLGGLLWRIRGRAGGRQGGRRLEVLERAALTPQHSLHLVRLGERVAVLATHAGGTSLLSGWDPEKGDGR